MFLKNIKHKTINFIWFRSIIFMCIKQRRDLKISLIFGLFYVNFPTFVATQIRFMKRLRIRRIRIRNTEYYYYTLPIQANVFFRTYEIKSECDRVLIYLTLYVTECLKKLQGCICLPRSPFPQILQIYIFISQPFFIMLGNYFILAF